MPILRYARVAMAFVAIVGVPGSACAEPWPQRPIRIIVPFAAGGSSDLAARIVARYIGETFAQQVVVENRPGASGALAAEAVARAPADGYTLLMATTAQVSIMPRIAKTSYDPRKDLAPVGVVATNPFVLAVHPSLPVRTVGELIAFARAQPTPLAYASSGPGSVGHLSMELFLHRAGLGMTVVNYKGGTEPLNALLAGHVKVMVLNLSAVAPFASSDALRLIAVTSGTRAPQIPNVPTFIESGFANFNILNWEGLMAPAGTDRAIVDRIAGAVAQATSDPKAAALLAANGLTPVGSSPSEFAAMLAADTRLWAEAVADAGLAGN